MLEKIVRHLEKTDNVNRSIYIWNAVNAMVLAMQSPVVLAVATRTNGEADAGIFSIALAEANLMYFLGQYGLRRYQSSDVREDFKFCEYHAMRIITTFFMVIGCLIYGLMGIMNKGYSSDKFMVIMGICLIKAIQSYADVLHGHLQQKGRLDVAGKAATIRYTAELVAYVVILLLLHDLLLAVIVCLAVSFVIFMLTSYNATRFYTDTMSPSISWDVFKRLAIEGFPLFIGLFLNMYISNAPKYAIDTYLNDDIQAIYNMIFMPTYVVQMVTQFIFNPVLTVYAELWLSREEKKFRRLIKMIRNMCFAVLGLAVLALVIAATIAIPVLSAIFGTDLSDYRAELCVIMFAGGMLGYSIYFSTLMAVIRAQKSLIYCYGIVSAMALVMSGPFVKNYGIMGAASLYAILMTLLTIALLIATVVPLKREWNLIKKKNNVSVS